MGVLLVMTTVTAGSLRGKRSASSQPSGSAARACVWTIQETRARRRAAYCLALFGVSFARLVRLLARHLGRT